jgi:LysM repeat protein
MSTRSSSISARVLAPAALVASALAVLVVIAASIGGGDGSNAGGGDSDPPTAVQQPTGQPTTAAPPQPETYTIEAGDTLGAIAEETGVPVDTLQEINPELDPQALIAGQQIKLRE